MTLALVLALLLAVADTTGAPERTAPPDPGRQVITRADIEAAGLYRIPDLFRLIDGVRTQTVDGFTWRTSSAGRPFGAEAWILLVDGVRLESDQWGEQNLSLVPVAITHVDSVEVWTEPRLVAGTFAPGGELHIHTAQTQRGGQIRTGFGIGNEVGDPGPYRYVPELASRNVDKFGADYEGLAGAAGEGGRVQARFKLLRFYATDEAAVRRNREAIGGNPALRVFAPAVRAETDAFGGTHTLSALGGGANDLWFFQPFGREIPVRRMWGQLGVHGDVALAAQTQAGYRVVYSENRLDAWDGTALRLDPRWAERSVRGGLSVQWRRDALTLGLGGELQRTTANGAEGFTLGTLTGHAVQTTARSRRSLDVALSAADGDQAASAALRARYRWGRWTGAVHLAHTAELAAQAGRFGFWYSRGYLQFARDIGILLGTPIIQAQGEAFGPIQEPRTSMQQVAGFDVRGALGAGLTLDAGFSVRRVSGFYFEDQVLAPDPASVPTAVPPTTLLNGGASTTAAGRLALRADRPRWNGRLFYDGFTLLDPDQDRPVEAVPRLWEAVPRHRAGVTATLAADPTFAVTGSLTYRSAARWPAYALLDGGNDGLYDDDIPALWLLNAAAEKWFWQRRVRASLLFRNLLGQEERYHPIGAALDLRFYLRVELKLGP